MRKYDTGYKPDESAPRLATLLGGAMLFLLAVYVMVWLAALYNVATCGAYAC